MTPPKNQVLHPPLFRRSRDFYSSVLISVRGAITQDVCIYLLKLCCIAWRKKSLVVYHTKSTAARVTIGAKRSNPPYKQTNNVHPYHSSIHLVHSPYHRKKKISDSYKSFAIKNTKMILEPRLNPETIFLAMQSNVPARMLSPILSAD